ncbi:meiosis mei2 [Fusarium tjaetaba]|uniref:Meiosis mei2 n=1 Tax=Fusarium tjaetaba TaxID=1567544 RepID=A0A8H5W2G3_9HYPO|nr:meiosis mei2 [Fusarium tjaetaba]KAF5642903.1 meiosis mei2 [Fusarium tjaetaba]
MSSHVGHRAYANMSSPAEGASDSIQGTPNTQITVFSPAESSQGTSIQGNTYVGQSQASEDPFVDGGLAQGSTLSATASSFQPIGQRFKGKNALVFYPEGSPTVAGALSQDMDISHRIEVCDTPKPPSIVDLGNFITELTQKGVRFHGGRNLETTGGHVYVVFEDLRDAAWALYAIRKAPKGWFTAYVKIRPERLDLGLVRFSELRQLSIEVNILNFAIIDPAHVDEIAQRALNVYGQLFALIRHLSFPNGAFRGVAQFCKAADAFIAFKAFGNGISTGGVVITLSKPDDVGAALDINTLAASMGDMSVQQGPRGVGRGRHQSFFALNAPQGNPFAAAGAASLPFPTNIQQQPFTGQQFGPPPVSTNSLVAFGNANSFGRFDPRRAAGRYGRGSRGLNNIVDLGELIAGRDVRTTIMLRNIPNKVDQPLLKKIVDVSSFGRYDFMYLRIDFANDCNVGYAFINFVKAEYIIDFFQARANKRWNCFRSDKVAEISYATIQGKDCLVQKFRNSSVMLEAEHYRPKLFYTIHSDDPNLVGQEEPFPGPDNQSKMKRSVENAEHVGLFTPTAGQYFRDEQRRRHSQYDRGTRLAELEEISYGSGVIPYRGSGRY